MFLSTKSIRISGGFVVVVVVVVVVGTSHYPFLCFIFSIKVWALAVNKSEDVIVSGGADSLINIWKVKL